MKSRLVLGLVCLSVGVLLSSVYWSGRKVEQKVEYRDRVVEKVVERRNVVIQTVKKPDGTVTTIETDKTIVEDSRSQLKDLKTSPVIPNYSLRLSTQLDLLNPKQLQYELALGRRLIGPVWIEAAYTTTHTSTLGLRLEF